VTSEPIAVTGRRGRFAELEAFLRKAGLSPSDIEKCMRRVGQPVEEFRVEDMLLGLLHWAKLGLRRKSIDETNKLQDYAKQVDRKYWPPEVARFIDRFKRPRGRMRSRQADINRFWSDPNRVAAFVAAFYRDKLRERHGARHKITRSDGSKSTISAEAVRLAVAQVNKPLERADASRRAHPKQVADRLGKGKRRVSPPRDPFDDDPNNRWD
jgi:hypothetical protein